jgi:hypothetical protein
VLFLKFPYFLTYPPRNGKSESKAVLAYLKSYFGSPEENMADINIMNLPYQIGKK